MKRARTKVTAKRRSQAPRVRHERRLALPASLEIQRVQELATLASNCLGAASALRVDGSAVTSADTAGLQLLIAIRRAAAVRGVLFKWGPVTPALRATAAILGLDTELGFSPAEAAA